MDADDDTLAFAAWLDVLAPVHARLYLRHRSPVANAIRFARFYGVKQTALGGLVGLLPYRLGRRTVWVDAARSPEVARRVRMETFAREALVSFGIFCAAAATLDRESATVH